VDCGSERRFARSGGCKVREGVKEKIDIQYFLTFASLCAPRAHVFYSEEIGVVRLNRA
jgi:hypothetical protein